MQARFISPSGRRITVTNPEEFIPFLWNEILRFDNSSVNRIDLIMANELPEIIQKLIEVLDRLIDEAKPYHSSDRIHKIINGKNVFFNQALTEHVVILRYNSLLDFFSEAQSSGRDIKIEISEIDRQ